MRFKHSTFTFRSIRIGKRISTFSKKNKRRKKDKGLILARFLKNLRIRKTTRRVKRAKLQIETFYAGNERSGGPLLVKFDWKYTGVACGIKRLLSRSPRTRIQHRSFSVHECPILLGRPTLALFH